MAHTKVSIRFRFIRIPVTWEPFEHAVLGLCLGGQLTKGASPNAIKVTELEPWACRREFFGLPRGDAARLVVFLNKVGVWAENEFELTQTTWSTSVDDVFDFRDTLRQALLLRKHFVTLAAPNLTPPKTLRDLMDQKFNREFPFRFELSHGAVGVVTLTNFRDVLWATVFADVAAGLQFKICQRKDCDQPFAITNRHKRKFCSQYCGHLVSQRRKRGERRRK